MFYDFVIPASNLIREANSLFLELTAYQFLLEDEGFQELIGYEEEPDCLKDFAKNLKPFDGKYFVLDNDGWKIVTKEELIEKLNER